jgi:hypothetical protein
MAALSIISARHEAALSGFYDCVQDEITLIDLEGQVEPFGAATITIGNWRKKTDKS